MDILGVELGFNLATLCVVAVSAVLMSFRVVPVAAGKQVSVGGIVWRLLAFKALFVKLPPTCSWLEIYRAVKAQGRYQAYIFIANMHKKLGPIFCLRFASTSYIFISDPVLIEKVMLDQKRFPSRGWTGVNTYLPLGLLALPTGDRWSLHRKHVARFLTTSFLKSYSEVIVDEISILLAKFTAKSENNEPANVHNDLSCCALDIIGRIAFGKYLHAQVDGSRNVYYQYVETIMNETVMRTVDPQITWYFPPSRKRAFDNAIKWIWADVRECINTEPAVGPDGEPAEQNMLQLLKELRDRMSEEELVQEIGTIMGAGHETTSNTVSWTLYLLAKNPDVMRKLQAEIDSVLGPDGELDFKNVMTMNYALACVYETLRLYPTVPHFPRHCVEGTKIGEYDCPKGATVYVTQWYMYRNEKWFSDPEEFKPERFVEEGKDVKQPATSRPLGAPGVPDFAFAPFGAGVRTCVGQRLAVVESLLLLCSVVRKFNFTLDKGKHGEEGHVYIHNDITIGPKKGLFLQFQPRAPA